MRAHERRRRPPDQFALGPLLLPQSRWLKRNALRLPEAAGPRGGEVGEGEPVLRLLVVGDSSAAGVGVADQAQALALPLATCLAKGLNAKVAWQLVAQTGIDTAEARALVQRSGLRPADVVVTALGVNDVSSQTSADRFILHTDLLWSELQQRTGARWAVFSGLPPIHICVPCRIRCAGISAGMRGGSTPPSVKLGQRRLGYCALQWTTDPDVLADDGFHPGPRLYPQWAQRLAQIVLARPRWDARL